MGETVTMPQLGESVVEGTIAKWLKQPGDPVARYEMIVSVVTDKVDAEIPSPTEGTMGELIAAEGSVVAVGDPICVIETAQGAPDARPADPAGMAGSPTRPAVTDEESAPAGAEAAPAVDAVASPSGANGDTRGADGKRLHLTPAVRVLAREHGVDLLQVIGTGFGGRITKKDVLEHVQSRDVAASATPAAAPAAAVATRPESRPAPAPLAPSEETVVPLTPIRRAIAEHMVRSRQTSPHAWVMMEVDMTRVAHVRSAQRDDFRRRHGVGLTYLPFVARAVLEGLRRYPTLNSRWTDQGVVLKHDLNLGIAIALEDNLIVPVIRNADRLTITGLATAMADLADRARTKRMSPDELQGGTFTLNNTGSLGTVLSQAIINQPQAAILAMDAVVKRPVVVAGDAIAVRSMMNLCLSFDHRINDGLSATRFLKAVKELLEATDPAAGLA